MRKRRSAAAKRVRAFDAFHGPMFGRHRYLSTHYSEKTMKTLTLSDHTQDMVIDAEKSRTAKHQAALQDYEKVVQRRAETSRRYRAELALAWQLKSLKLLVVSGWKVLFGSLPALPNRPVAPGVTQDEIVWATGGEGEAKVATHLSRQLNDDWTLVCGYRNSGGEIDQILVGPPGVFAIEVKFINGRVHCDGDQWRRDKFDRYGNLVETNLPLADKGGRGPSLQLNAATDRLQHSLDRNFGEGRIRRAVVFAHTASQIGQLSNQTVDLVATLDGWRVSDFVGFECVLSASNIEEILAVIVKDHNHHEQRHSNRQTARRTCRQVSA